MEAKRWREIAIANFDRYVTKRLIEPSYVVSSEGIDPRELGCLAIQMNCLDNKLHESLVVSLGRISRNPVKVDISTEDEETVIRQAAKLHIKESAVSLLNFKREFGRIIKELNHSNSNLHVTKEELYEFIKPLYLESVEEIFSI